MNETIEPRNVGNVCRLCLSAQEPKSSVFADEAIVGVPLATKIQTCLSIEILTSDRLSTSVCSDCSKKVHEWYAYKEYCLRSQEKLKQCLAEPPTDGVANIKAEPPDYEEAPSQLGTAELSDDETEEETRERRIKREVTEDVKAACVDSVDGTELLLNPMAVGGHREDDEDEREADRTEESAVATRRGGRRKRTRRGPQTHFRGSRRYKQRCYHCQIYLHSKWSYAKHTERFHSGELELSPEATILEPLVSLSTECNDKKRKAAEMTRTDDIEDVEDVEEELISLEKDAPLTPVQRNIISQLKTFSCYTCGLCFADRRTTLNHIRQHMPDLRPYTCIACLTEFADRSVYKLHCGASFECAMKIALVVPEHGTEKYFTCNMCLRSLANRKDLLSHLSRHSDRQYEQLTAAPPPPPPPPPPTFPLSVAKRRKLSRDRAIPAPYKNGDPAHNHTCLDCGMIYRYKQNMLKHVALCKTLPADKRMCYRCVDCGLTFLAFNKFQSHIGQAHGKRQIACHRCGCNFAVDHFLSHYRQHYAVDNMRESEARGLERWRNETMGPTAMHGRWNEAPNDAFSYAKARTRLSNDESTIAVREDGERRVARENGRYSIKTDPGGSNDVECHECGKVFANYTKLRRHARTVHEDGVGRYSCFTCAKTFVREEEWTEHVETEHRREADHVEICPLCPSVFENRQELFLHRRAVHGSNGEDRLACYICGKCFASETSLKIHRGHHFRVNSRLSIGGKKTTAAAAAAVGRANEDRARSGQDSIGPIITPRARKSFPNGGGGSGSPASAGRSRESLQCQVCDVRFDNVSDLGRHLWDVHCSRAKPEKPFTTDELRCELCTNVLPDEESLRGHLEWHEQNPILSNARREKREPEVPARCDQCGKYYSSIGNLRKHKKRHAAGGWMLESCRGRKRGTRSTGFTCDVCRKVFANRSIMAKHRISAHPSRCEPKRYGSPSSTTPPPLLPFASRDSKKSLACHLCGKIQADVRALAKHARVVHKISNAEAMLGEPASPSPSPPSAPRVSCTLCPKFFANLSNMRQHFTKVHGRSRIEDRSAQHQQQQQQQELRCEVEGCKRLFESRLAKLNHEKTHLNVVYTCALCPRHTLNPGAMAEHILAAHRANRISGYDKMTLCKKMDLDKYVVIGANGRQCPVCGITYPNYKALKIHYLKIHEDEATSA